MASNQEFSKFKPVDKNGLEIYIGGGAEGYDSMNEGYPLLWSTREANKGRLYRKSDFTFVTNGYMTTRSELTRTTTIKQKGQPIFNRPNINPITKDGNTLSTVNSPILMTYIISLLEGTPLTTDFLLEMTSTTNAQWLEIAIDYNDNDTYEQLVQASLGDYNETILDGGNRGALLNRIRESLLYEFYLRGILKLGGYQTYDNDSKLVFRMYYEIPSELSPASNFTDFMGIGTSDDFNAYKQIEFSNGNESIKNATYTQIKIEELSSTDLKLKGYNAPDENYQDYYMLTKTYGEENTFDCRILFNPNPTYVNGQEDVVHYFESFADPTNGDYYLRDDTAFIFHIKIYPKGFARKWSANENNYSHYLQWNYTPFDIKVVIMLAELTPYLYFNNSSSTSDDSVLLEAAASSTDNLPVNSNMKWSINELSSIDTYNVNDSEITDGEPLYIESNS